MKGKDSSSWPVNILDQLEVIWTRYVVMNENTTSDDLHDHKMNVS